MAAPQPGLPFPDRPLPRLGGGQIQLSQSWSAGPGLIALGHSECGTTRLALPFVDRLHRRRGSGGSVMVVLQDEPGPAAAYARELGLELPVALEADPYPLAAALALRTVPTLFLVGRDGIVTRVYEGYRREHLEALAPELGVEGSFYTAADDGPSYRPG